jgi:alpha-beta hydrolase superfamily lysophospholipase
VKKLVTSLPVDHSGTTFYVKAWRHEQNAANGRHPVLVVHDLGEQTEDYRAAAHGFVANGYSVYLFDLRGHGRSGRRLGHAPSFNILVKDLLQVAAWVRHQEGGRAPVIIGHGVGALILLDFTKQYGDFCRAAVLSAPCMELAAPVRSVSRLLLKLLADAMPTLRLPAALCPRFTRTLRAETVGHDEDPRLVYFPRLTAVFAHELLLALKRVEARFIQYHGAVLVLCPDQDTVCLYHQLKRSAAIHNEHNLEIADLPGVGHGVFTDGDAARDAALALILPWLSRVLAPRATPPARDDLRVSGASARGEKPGATKA